MTDKQTDGRTDRHLATARSALCVPQIGSKLTKN